MYRTIIESKHFESNRNKINSDVRRMDGVLEGVIWVLSRNPKKGQETSVNGIFAIKTDGTGFGEPSLVIYYCFNDQNVILLDIQKSMN